MTTAPGQRYAHLLHHHTGTGALQQAPDVRLPSLKELDFKYRPPVSEPGVDREPPQAPPDVQQGYPPSSHSYQQQLAPHDVVAQNNPPASHTYQHPTHVPHLQYPYPPPPAPAPAPAAAPPPQQPPQAPPYVQQMQRSSHIVHPQPHTHQAGWTQPHTQSHSIQEQHNQYSQHVQPSRPPHHQGFSRSAPLMSVQVDPRAPPSEPRSAHSARSFAEDSGRFSYDPRQSQQTEGRAEFPSDSSRSVHAQAGYPQMEGARMNGSPAEVAKTSYHRAPDSRGSSISFSDQQSRMYSAHHHQNSLASNIAPNEAARAPPPGPPPSAHAHYHPPSSSHSIHGTQNGIQAQYPSPVVQNGMHHYSVRAQPPAHQNSYHSPTEQAPVYGSPTSYLPPEGTPRGYPSAPPQSFAPPPADMRAAYTPDSRPTTAAESVSYHPQTTELRPMLPHSRVDQSQSQSQGQSQGQSQSHQTPHQPHPQAHQTHQAHPTHQPQHQSHQAHPAQAYDTRAPHAAPHSRPAYVQQGSGASSSIGEGRHPYAAPVEARPEYNPPPPPPLAPPPEPRQQQQQPVVAHLEPPRALQPSQSQSQSMNPGQGGERQGYGAEVAPPAQAPPSEGGNNARQAFVKPQAPGLPRAPLPRAPQHSRSADDAARETKLQKVRESIWKDIVGHCNALYTFANKYSQHQSATGAPPQPTREEMEEMTHRASEVVRLLEELRSPAPSLHGGKSRSLPVPIPSGAGAGARMDVDAPRDENRPPKRPWEDMNGDNSADSKTHLRPLRAKTPASAAAAEKVASGSGSGSGSGGPGALKGAKRTAAERDMEIIRSKRAMTTSMAAANGASSGSGTGSGGGSGTNAAKTKYRKRSRATPPGKCHSCNIRETPEWRRGPDGARTLCNACGLHYAKLVRKRDKALQAEGGSAADVGKIDIEMLRASARAAENAGERVRTTQQGAAAGGGSAGPPGALTDTFDVKSGVHQGSFQIEGMGVMDTSGGGSSQPQSAHSQAQVQPQAQTQAQAQQAQAHSTPTQTARSVKQMNKVNKVNLTPQQHPARPPPPPAQQQQQQQHQQQHQQTQQQHQQQTHAPPPVNGTPTMYAAQPQQQQHSYSHHTISPVSASTTAPTMTQHQSAPPPPWMAASNGNGGGGGGSGRPYGADQLQHQSFTRGSHSLANGVSR